MFDYTSAAKEADRYARDGGPDYGHHINRQQVDPVFAHRIAEARVSASSEPVAQPPRPPMPTAAEMAADAARQRGIDYQEQIEARALFPRKPYINPTNNPHDE